MRSPLPSLKSVHSAHADEVISPRSSILARASDCLSESCGFESHRVAIGCLFLNIRLKVFSNLFKKKKNTYLVASTRGLSHRPLFGLVINMSAILIPSTTRRSHGFESRCDYQMAPIASDRDIMDMLYRFHTICRRNLLPWLYRLSERIYPCHG